MSRPRVLIIDDEPSNLGLLRQILKEEYNLFFAKGEGGWPPWASRAGTYPAGRAHARHGWLRSVPPAQGRSGSRRIPVLFITASDNADSESQGFEAGGVDYIYKPVCPSTVRARCAIISPWCASISSSAAIAPPSSC